MQFIELFDPLYALSGLGVGAIVGLTGVGGGSLMTPLLILLFGVHPATAVGTDLLYAAATKSAGTLAHGINKAIDWKIVGLLALGSVPAAMATVAFLSATGVDSHAVSHLISTILGVMLVLTAAATFLRPQIVAFAHRRRGPRHSAQHLFTVGTGAVIGTLVSVSSIGAGAIGVTVLLLLYPNLSTVRVVGSDIAHAVPLTLVAGMGHWAIGSIDWAMLLSLLAGSIPGVVIACHFAPRANELTLRLLLGTVLGVVGVRMLIG